MRTNLVLASVCMGLLLGVFSFPVCAAEPVSGENVSTTSQLEDVLVLTRTSKETYLHISNDLDVNYDFSGQAVYVSSATNSGLALHWKYSTDRLTSNGYDAEFSRLSDSIIESHLYVRESSDAEYQFLTRIDTAGILRLLWKEDSAVEPDFVAGPENGKLYQFAVIGLADSSSGIPPERVESEGFAGYTQASPLSLDVTESIEGNTLGGSVHDVQYCRGLYFVVQEARVLIFNNLDEGPIDSIRVEKPIVKALFSDDQIVVLSRFRDESTLSVYQFLDGNYFPIQSSEYDQRMVDLIEWNGSLYSISEVLYDADPEPNPDPDTEPLLENGILIEEMVLPTLQRSGTELLLRAGGYENSFVHENRIIIKRETGSSTVISLSDEAIILEKDAIATPGVTSFVFLQDAVISSGYFGSFLGGFLDDNTLLRSSLHQEYGLVQGALLRGDMLYLVSLRERETPLPDSDSPFLGRYAMQLLRTTPTLEPDAIQVVHEFNADTLESISLYPDGILLALGDAGFARINLEGDSANVTTFRGLTGSSVELDYTNGQSGATLVLNDYPDEQIKVVGVDASGVTLLNAIPYERPSVSDLSQWFLVKGETALSGFNTTISLVDGATRSLDTLEALINADMNSPYTLHPNSFNGYVQDPVSRDIYRISYPNRNENIEIAVYDFDELVQEQYAPREIITTPLINIFNAYVGSGLSDVNGSLVAVQSEDKRFIMLADLDSDDTTEKTIYSPNSIIGYELDPENKKVYTASRVDGGILISSYAFVPGINLQLENAFTIPTETFAIARFQRRDDQLFISVNNELYMSSIADQLQEPTLRLRFSSVPRWPFMVDDTLYVHLSGDGLTSVSLSPEAQSLYELGDPDPAQNFDAPLWRRNHVLLQRGIDTWEDFCPNRIFLDQTTNTIYILETFTNRISTYDSINGYQVLFENDENDPVLNNPYGFDVVDGRILIANTFNNTVIEYNIQTENFTLLAGTGSPDYNGNDSPPQDLSLNQPSAVLDHKGTLYIAEPENRLIRWVGNPATVEIAASGPPLDEGRERVISGDVGAMYPRYELDLGAPIDLASYGDSIAFSALDDAIVYKFIHTQESDVVEGIYGGIFGTPFSLENNAFPNTNRYLQYPEGIHIEYPMLYIADTGNWRIVEYDLETQTSTFHGGNFPDVQGDGLPSFLMNATPTDVTVDADGNILYCDPYSGVIGLVAKEESVSREFSWNPPSAVTDWSVF